MVTLQVLLSEEQLKYARDLLVKAQGTFQRDGERFTLGNTLVRVLAEWSKSKGFIKETIREVTNNRTLDLIKNDPEEMRYLQGVIENVDKRPNATNTKVLFQYILKIDPSWHRPYGESTTKALVTKMKSILVNGVQEKKEEVKSLNIEIEMDLNEAGDIIKKEDPNYDSYGKGRDEIIEHAKKLRGNK